MRSLAGAIACAVALLAAAAPSARAAGLPQRLTGHEFRFERRPGLPYVEREGRMLRFDLYLPDAPGPHPAALVIHGGGWKTGGRATMDAAVLARALAREGIATASLSYRLAPRFAHPAQLDDCRAALRHLRAHAAELGLDPTRIAAVGASSGGHLAALLATGTPPANGERPVCAVTICAPFDLLPVPGEAPDRIAIGLVSGFLGLDRVADVDRRIELLRARGRDASPLYHVTSDDRPMLVVDAAEDWLVTPSQADRMVGALAAAEVPHRHVRLRDAGHCEFLLDRSRDWCAEPPDWWREVRAFLRRELLGRDAR